MSEQPNTSPMTDLEQYYEALYMKQHSKPGSAQEKFWSRRLDDLEWVGLTKVKN